MSQAPSQDAFTPGGWQPGLFDEGDDPVVDTTFAAARRTELDATSWIEHVPGWLRCAGVLFDELLVTGQWEQRTRWMYSRRVVEPRLTAEYADISAAPQRTLQTVTAALSAHYGVAYRYLWLNLYRTHRDSRPAGTAIRSARCRRPARCRCSASVRRGGS